MGGGEVAREGVGDGELAGTRLGRDGVGMDRVWITGRRTSSGRCARRVSG